MGAHDFCYPLYLVHNTELNRDCVNNQEEEIDKTFELILLSLAVADLIKGLSDSVYAVYDITQGISITFSKGPFQ